METLRCTTPRAATRGPVFGRASEWTSGVNRVSSLVPRGGSAISGDELESAARPVRVRSEAGPHALVALLVVAHPRHDLFDLVDHREEDARLVGQLVCKDCL